MGYGIVIRMCGEYALFTRPEMKVERGSYDVITPSAARGIIEAHFEMVPEKCGPDDTVEKHYSMALRRLRKGQYYSAPCLGTREFGARVELIEDGDIPKSALTGSRELGWMLYDMDFSNPED